MGIGYIISIYLHVVFAAFWIGGMLFLPLVMMPALRNNTEKVALLYKTGVRFRLYGWLALIGLTITGLLNMHAKGMPFSREFLVENSYGSLLGLKLMFFAVMLLLQSIHDFYLGNKAVEQMQQDEISSLRNIARWSGRVNLLLTLVIAFLGVALSRGGI